MHTITINIEDKVLDNVLYLLKNLSDIEIVENKNHSKRTEHDNTHEERWEYWKDVELDNFGKIAIGLSKHNYDNEDFSKW